jgi:phosphotransferase system  glucose/maltose/N-acetylglucosamine-specific IIC component
MPIDLIVIPLLSTVVGCILWCLFDHDYSRKTILEGAFLGLLNGVLVALALHSTFNRL